MFDEFAAATRPLIDRQLSLLLRHRKNVMPAPYQDLTKQLTKLVMRGGKRLRPLLCITTYQGYGGRDKAIMQVAAGQELLHAFLLIHDDIIDRDYFRWHGRNVTGEYFERYSKTMTPRDALHFAESQALLAGDVAMALANQALLTARFSPAALGRAGCLQQQIIQQVLAGETADVGYSLAAHMPDEAQIIAMYQLKTAGYSFALPLQIGALLAGAASDELTKLTDLANSLGLAYQLQDDMLGMFGDEAKTGKSALSDLREGKRTLLIIKTFALAPRQKWVTLARLLGNPDITETDVRQARNIIIDSGARQYVADLSTRYIETAQAVLQTTNLSESAQRQLQDFMARLDQRQR